ncbi:MULTISPECIES: CHAP domain-containing protein [Calothrix]|uniref:CHAP domain-containing protein n=2 Tax=Calothrix TaxID=1186 RepID=A0ABR8A2W5_9CYAN|nr:MULTISPECIES: CHAP domain-containing protein [Calothrix]MBD2194225.1 CHAP domain-containing protein [Calothrix parietina FACHB-288]MBD2225021.1 CHAP domain-containing protein [Calothrix anomala FACHB-343]
MFENSQNHIDSSLTKLNNTLNSLDNNSLNIFPQNRLGLDSQQLLSLAGETLIQAWSNHTDPTQALIYAREGNCTWYAYGRLKELGFTPEDILLPPGQRNANQWGGVLYNGARTFLGSNETPQLGDVAQYYLNGQNHVAIVEKVENGRVYLSESHYNQDFDGDKDGDGITTDGTFHRIVNYTVNNPHRYIRLVRH